MKRLSMDGIVASRPGVGHVVLSERPLRKYALLFGLDPLSPRSSSFHQKLAYWLRKHFAEAETEPAFVVLDRKDRSEAKLSEIRRRFSVGEFAGAVLVHWSEYIAPLEEEILDKALPYLSISTRSANPDCLILGQRELVVEAYQWLARHDKLPAIAFCGEGASPAREDLDKMPGLTICNYHQAQDIYRLTQTALLSESALRSIIVPDDIAQIHAQYAILANPQSAPVLLAHMAIKGDVYPAGIPRLLLEIDPHNVAAFCLQWLRQFPAGSQRGTIPIRPELRQQF